MGIYNDFIIFAIGFLVIIKSADFFTSGAEGIAKAFNIPRVIVGLTIVSLATTAPEFTVSVISSYMGVGGIAVGNAVGSCLANIGLVLAVAAIIGTAAIGPRVIKREIPFLIFVSVLLYLFMLDGWLSFLDGLLLCTLLVTFFTYIILRESKARRARSEKVSSSYSIKKDSLRFLLGAAGVVASAKYAIIPSGINIAHFLKVPEVVIGLSMVAIGTSLPELVTAIVASTKKMGELAAGNVIGANILNILWVLGFSSLVSPLAIDTQTKNIAMPAIIFMTLLIFLFSRTKFKISRNEGLIFFVIYISYITYIFKFAYH